MNIGTQEDFKEYLLSIKKHNDSLTKEDKEGVMVGNVFISDERNPSDEGYYNWYINNKL